MRTAAEVIPSIVRERLVGKSETRARITNAASSLVVREGFANLTLDAVAREADISKGGLLYHFPSKRALLEGMVDQRCEEFEEQVENELVHETGPGGLVRAFIRATSNRKQTYQQESAALFAVLANDRELLEKVRHRREAFKQMIAAEQIDPVLTTIVMLALDGLCFNELMMMGGPRGAHRERVLEKLLAMASSEPTKKIRRKI